MDLDRQVQIESRLYSGLASELPEIASQLHEHPEDRSRLESSRAELESVLIEITARLREHGVQINQLDDGGLRTYDVSDVPLRDIDLSSVPDASQIDSIKSYLSRISRTVTDLTIASMLHLYLADIDYGLMSDSSLTEQMNAVYAFQAAALLGEMVRPTIPLHLTAIRRSFSSILRLVYNVGLLIFAAVHEGVLQSIDNDEDARYYDNNAWYLDDVLSFMEAGRARELREVLERRKFLEGTPELLRRFAKLEAFWEAGAARRALEQGSAEWWQHSWRSPGETESGMTGAALGGPAERDAAIAYLSALMRDLHAEFGGQELELASAVRTALKSAGYSSRGLEADADVLAAMGMLIDPITFARRLPARSVVLSYYCYMVGSGGDGCVLFALQSSGEVRFRRLSARPQDVAAASQFVAHALARGAKLNDQAVTGRLAWTAEVLLGPVADWLRDSDELAIVPDAALFGLPFAALPMPGGRGLLLENLAVRIWPSLMFADEAASRPSPSEVTSSPVVLGIDTFATFSPLAYAEEEARQVASLLGGGPALTGPEATADALVERAAGAGAIHIASHAKFEALAPMASWIALKSPDGDDELVTAADILGMLLDASVVTLSACDTANPYGLGVTYAGDPLGLARAFLGVGTQSVVASLWKVDDSATAQLMTSFYQGLAGGASPARSLRTAQLQFAKAGRPARLWAPFTVITGTW